MNSHHMQIPQIHHEFHEADDDHAHEQEFEAFRNFLRAGKPVPCPRHQNVLSDYVCQQCCIPVCVQCKMVGSHSRGDCARHRLLTMAQAHEMMIAQDVAREARASEIARRLEELGEARKSGLSGRQFLLCRNHPKVFAECMCLDDCFIPMCTACGVSHDMQFQHLLVAVGQLSESELQDIAEEEQNLLKREQAVLRKHVTERMPLQTTSVVLAGHSSNVNSAVYSPDGRWTASASSDTIVIVRESGSDEVVCTLKHGGKVFSLAFSADSKRLLSGSEDNTARVWEVARRKCLSELKHPSWVKSVAWSPDDTFFLSGCMGNEVRKWDAETYECLHTLDGHTDYVRSLAISPNSSFFVSGEGNGSGNRIAIVWEVHAGEAPREVRRLEGHTNSVYGVAISPDNSRIATASYDKTVKMWNLAGDEVWSVGVGEKAWSVCFSPGGRFLSVGIGDNSKTTPAPVLILDAGTGAEVVRLDGHGEAVRAVNYHPLGHTLFSGSWDNTCREWTLPAALVDASFRATPAPSPPQPRTSGDTEPKPEPSPTDPQSDEPAGSLELLEKALGRLQVASPGASVAPFEAAIRAAQSLDNSVAQEVSGLLDLPLTMHTLPKLRSAGLDGLSARVATAWPVIAGVSAQLAEFCEGDVPPVTNPIAATELLRSLHNIREKDPLEPVRTKVRDLVYEIADLVKGAVDTASELDKVRSLVAHVVELTSEQNLAGARGIAEASAVEDQCRSWIGAQYASANAALAVLSPESVGVLKTRLSTLEQVQTQWDELSSLLEKSGDLEFAKMEAVMELDTCALRLHTTERSFDKYGDRVSTQLATAQDAMEAAKSGVRKIVDVERRRDGLVAEIAASKVEGLLTDEMRKAVKGTDLPEFFLPSINMFDKVEDLAAAGSATASVGHYQGEMFFLKKYPLVRLDAFKREAKQLRKCDHAHVIAPLGFIEDTNFLCLVLPFYQNGSLQQHIVDASLSASQRLEIYRDLLLALEHVHSRNLVHCDVKPHNILLSDSWRGVLADFDVSHEDRTVTMREKTNRGFGATVAYAPPEVMAGEKAAPPADIYSLGVTIREVEGERIGLDLEALVVEMATDDPDDRPTATQCLKHGVFSRQQTYADIDDPFNLPDSTSTKKHLRTVIAKYSFQATDEIEMSVAEGEEVYLVDGVPGGDDWLQIQRKNGSQRGFAPGLYFDFTSGCDV